jgi:hypothetical protein
MTIDKQRLQSLLWSEVAAWKANCVEWKRNTEALQEFLGEKTVEEVALELLAENERLSASPERQIIRAAVTEAVKGIADAAAADAKAGTLKEIELLKAENEALRKDAERYRWLQHGHSGYIEVVEWIGPHATGMTGEDLDALVDNAMSKAVKP